MSNKSNFCDRCGKYIEGKKYNPYNETFDHYTCGTGKYDKKMCLKCAEWFVETWNKCKGGYWILREADDINEVKENALNYLRNMKLK